jgi:glucokinase
MKRFVVGIDVGGTNTEVAIIDNDGAILDGFNVSTRCCESFDQYISLISDGVSDMIKRNNFEQKIERIGVGAPNANFFSGNIEHAPNLLWKGILPFASMLQEKTNIPVVLTNDANAAAIGEHVFGGATGMNDFIVVTLGTGLGSGIFSNGKLIYGHDGFAGELGHTLVETNHGRLCGCGRRGCLETYVSSTGIVTTAIELLANNQEKSVLKEIPANQLTSLDISNAANAGDAVAIKAFEYTGKMLAIALANVVSITSPEAIFISGGLVKSGKLLFDPLIENYNNCVMTLFKGKVKILPSLLCDKNTGLLGAAALAFNNN